MKASEEQLQEIVRERGARQKIAELTSLVDTLCEQEEYRDSISQSLLKRIKYTIDDHPRVEMPWHSAKTGEVWELTFCGIECVNAVLLADGATFMLLNPLFKNGNKFTYMFSANITKGVKVPL